MILESFRHSILSSVINSFEYLFGLLYIRRIKTDFVTGISKDIYNYSVTANKNAPDFSEALIALIPDYIVLNPLLRISARLPCLSASMNSM